MNKGAFQTSREIFTNSIWEDVAKFRIFFYIYGNAVFAEEGVMVGDINVKRGQFLRSYRSLRDDLQYVENRSIKKYSLSVISKKIDQLVKENRLKIESTELGTLFTVVNYAKYQGLSNYKTDNENGERTQRERRENAVRTEKERSENNNKNVKNVKNDNDIYIYPQSEIDLSPIELKTKNPHEDHIAALIKKCEIKNMTLHHYDIVNSYIGLVDIEVIEAALKKSQGKIGAYAVATLQNMVKDGITKKEQVLPKPEVKNKPQVVSFDKKRKPQIEPVQSSSESKVDEEKMKRVLEMARALEGG